MSIPLRAKSLKYGDRIDFRKSKWAQRVCPESPWGYFAGLGRITDHKVVVRFYLGGIQNNAYQVAVDADHYFSVEREKK